MDRQGKLGEIAIRNADLETAEKAFTKIVTHGSGSCFHNPEAYLRLAEINLKTGKAKKAAEVLDSLQKAIENANKSKYESAFKSNPVADFCLAVGRTDGERLKGDRKSSEAHFQNALDLLSKNPGLPFPTNSVLRFVVDCLIFEKYDDAAKFVRTVCENSNRREALKEAALGYCPDEVTKTKVRTLFIEMEDVLEESLHSGIELAKKGDWEGAAKLSAQAADKLPGNLDAQLMASQILLKAMEFGGWDDERFLLGRRYLERARRLSPSDPRLAKLGEIIDRVKKKFGIKAEPARKKYEPPKRDPNAEKRGHDRSEDAAGLPELNDFILK